MASAPTQRVFVAAWPTSTPLKLAKRRRRFRVSDDKMSFRDRIRSSSTPGLTRADGILGLVATRGKPRRFRFKREASLPMTLERESGQEQYATEFSCSRCNTGAAILRVGRWLRQSPRLLMNG